MCCFLVIFRAYYNCLILQPSISLHLKHRLIRRTTNYSSCELSWLSGILKTFNCIIVFFIKFSGKSAWFIMRIVVILTLIHSCFLSLIILLSPTYLSLINISFIVLCINLLIWLLDGGISFLMKLFLKIFFAKIIKPNDILLHLYCTYYFIILLDLNLFLLFTLLHFHKLPYLRFFNY